MVYCDDKKKKVVVLNMSWKTCLRRYTNQIAFLLLSLTELIQLAINISSSYMAENKRSCNGRTSYIYFQTLGIYTSSLRITVPKKVPIAKIWGLMPLNTSFMTNLGLNVVIIAKNGIFKWKRVSLSVMPRYIHTIIHCLMSLAEYGCKLIAQKRLLWG